MKMLARIRETGLERVWQGKTGWVSTSKLAKKLEAGREYDGNLQLHACNTCRRYEHRHALHSAHAVVHGRSTSRRSLPDLP